jgi:hypothetical protein
MNINGNCLFGEISSLSCFTNNLYSASFQSPGDGMFRNLSCARGAFSTSFTIDNAVMYNNNTWMNDDLNIINSSLNGLNVSLNSYKDSVNQANLSFNDYKNKIVGLNDNITVSQCNVSGNTFLSCPIQCPSIYTMLPDTIQRGGISSSFVTQSLNLPNASHYPAVILTVTEGVHIIFGNPMYEVKFVSGYFYTFESHIPIMLPDNTFNTNDYFNAHVRNARDVVITPNISQTFSLPFSRIVSNSTPTRYTLSVRCNRSNFSNTAAIIPGSGLISVRIA